MTTPTSPKNNDFDRRTLIRRGGLTLGLGAFLGVRCRFWWRYGSRPRRTRPERNRASRRHRNDVVYLRTMQSLEHSLVELLSALTASGHFSAAQQTYVERFVSDHVAASGVLGEHIAAAGGEPYACENEWVRNRFINPVIAAVDSSDDSRRDARNVAHAFETMLSHSYQHLVGLRRPRNIAKG